MNRLTNLKRDTLSTEKFEEHIEQVKNDIKRYREVEKSKELEEFIELRAIVETQEFQENKNFLLHQKYRNTKEFSTLFNYRRLKLRPSIQEHLSFAQFENVAEFLEFEKSEDYAQLRNRAAVRKDSRLRLFYVLDHSVSMRMYRRVEKSAAIAEYRKLEAEIATEDFQKRNEFWRNPNRWYTTEESVKDARYLTLKESDDIQFYLAQNPNQIAEWESYNTIYQDEFDWVHMKDSQWEAGFYYSNPNLKTNHSYVNELQAYNNGHNTYAANSVLTVETKEENVTAPAWHPTKGFIQKEYNWTSDTLQTAKKFHLTEGMVMAKARVRGNANAAVYLAAGELLPLVKLMQFDGKKIVAGLRSKDVDETVEVKGLKADQWFVYTVLVSAKNITFYVNNQEILNIANSVYGAKLYPSLSEFLPDTKQAAVGALDVDWIRVYAK